MHDGTVDPAGELRAQAAGADPLEAVDQHGQGDLGWVVHKEVHVVGLAVELGEFGTEVFAHLAHSVFAAAQHVVVEDVTPVLRSEDQMRVQVVDDATTPSYIRIWFPSR